MNKITGYKQRTVAIRSLNQKFQRLAGMTRQFSPQFISSLNSTFRIEPDFEKGRQELKIKLEGLKYGSEEYKIDPTYCLTHSLPIIEETVGRSPFLYEKTIDFAMRLADKGIDPSDALEYGIPAIAEINSPRTFGRAIKDLEKSVMDLEEIESLKGTLKLLPYMAKIFRNSPDEFNAFVKDLNIFARQIYNDVGSSYEDTLDILFNISRISTDLKPAEFHRIKNNIISLFVNIKGRKNLNLNDIVRNFGSMLASSNRSERFMVVNLMCGIDKDNMARYFSHPVDIRDSLQLQSIEFIDGGDSPNIFHLLTRSLLEQIPRTNPKPLPNIEPVSTKSLPFTTVENILKDYRMENSTFIGAFGRTLVFKNEQGEYLGIKLAKDGEKNIDLVKEGYWMKYFGENQSELGLQSIYPDFKKVCRMKEISHEFEIALEKAASLGKGFEIKITEAGNYTAMIYKTTEDFFKYLSDPKLADTEFMDSSFKSLGDLFALAKHNLVHTALIELFHNLIQSGRVDRGRYIWMIDIIRPMGTRCGSGRLHAWTSSVQYPNLRKSGLADFAEMDMLDNLLNPQHPRSAHLSTLHTFEAARDNFYLAEYLGEYLLSWSLIVGSRFLKNGDLDWNDEKKVKKLSETLKQGFSHSFSVYSERGHESTKLFLESMIDWERLSRQMSFFMTDAYIESLKAKSIPEGIYGKNVRMSFSDNIEGSRGWTQNGWSSDGKNPDLGPVNGPIPLQELIRAVYLSSTFMIIMRNLDSEVRGDK